MAMMARHTQVRHCNMPLAAHMLYWCGPEAGEGAVWCCQLTRMLPCDAVELVMPEDDGAAGRKRRAEGEAVQQAAGVSAVISAEGAKRRMSPVQVGCWRQN